MKSAMFAFIRLVLLAAIAAVLAATAAAQGVRPESLAQAVAATQAAKAPYAFDFDLDTTKQNWRAHFDPAARPHLQLLEPARAQLNDGERRAFDKMADEMEGLSWCASENLGRVSEMRPIGEDAQTITYAFQPTAESVRGREARRFAERLRGEMTLTKDSPDITRVRLFAPAAFSPLPLVRLDAIDIVIRCAVAPNGRRYAGETVTQIRGRALGANFDERTVQRTRNLRAAP